MIQVGDYVTFALDGAKGMVIGLNDGLCQVMWEDHFVSWEKIEMLKKEE